MPIVTIHMLEGRTTEERRALAARMTEAICDTIGAQPERVRIIMKDMPHDEYAVGGKLVCDQDY